MKFIKMHGLGNDFIIVDCRHGDTQPSIEQISNLSDRKRGIGCDQFIALERSDRADVFMRIYNQDGSESEACGNATRCVADLILKEKNSTNVVIETVAGLLDCVEAEEGLITVDMGAPQFDWASIPLSKECDTLSIHMRDELPNGVGVNIGNPHIVFFVEDDVEKFSVHEIGPKIETHQLFPQKTNVEFCNVLKNNEIRMRVWERGVGETEACGSGACAVAVAAMRRGLIDGRQCRVVLNGGPLYFHWREVDDHILMTGSATYVFQGEI